MLKFQTVPAVLGMHEPVRDGDLEIAGGFGGGHHVEADIFPEFLLELLPKGVRLGRVPSTAAVQHVHLYHMRHFCFIIYLNLLQKSVN